MLKHNSSILHGQIYVFRPIYKHNFRSLPNTHRKMMLWHKHWSQFALYVGYTTLPSLDCGPSLAVARHGPAIQFAGVLLTFTKSIYLAMKFHTACTTVEQLTLWTDKHCDSLFTYVAQFVHNGRNVTQVWNKCLEFFIVFIKTTNALIWSKIKAGSAMIYLANLNYYSMYMYSYADRLACLVYYIQLST